MYKSFVEMPVWQNAHKLSIEVYQVTVNLPRSEDYGLTSQIRRSSNSISANISEAFGRKTRKDKAHFYSIARGSAFETQNHLLYGNKIEYFEDDFTKRLIDEYSLLIFDLNKLISYLT
ncbi:MAG TPA: four helix bundle protein [Perlabentimonas sp.]|nr:four helix bundle protein [Bacteroidales bacterium]MDD4673441.1 four helix bundle protein [Bacteroidales bacterium]MDY0348095.1 four helix bundle protein [Tenuifilaceae bacterium]HZJ74813.1 four helix bundle protein [Perlabentimonas sp.]